MHLIILPGWKQNSQDWQQVTKKLSQDIKVSVINLPGFGIEPISSQDWGIPEYSEWVRNKIEKDYENEDIILLGHSFGGRLACEIASQRPNWLKALILFAAPVLYRPNKKVLFLKYFSRKTPNFIKNLFKRFSSQDYNEVKNTNLNTIFKKVYDVDQTEKLQKINIKTFLIWGEKDTSVSVRIGKEANNLLKNSTLDVLPNCGHNIHINNPNLLYGTIKKIITKNL
jgi:pimeloyl-ACP methyl ester carboxylesterase